MTVAVNAACPSVWRGALNSVAMHIRADPLAALLPAMRLVGHDAVVTNAACTLRPAIAAVNIAARNVLALPVPALGKAIVLCKNHTPPIGKATRAGGPTATAINVIAR